MHATEQKKDKIRNRILAPAAAAAAATVAKVKLVVGEEAKSVQYRN